MDPLSITASAIAIATLCGHVCTAFGIVRAFYGAFPGRLTALQDEVMDFQGVLMAVATVVRDRDHDFPREQLANLPFLLDKGKTKILHLDSILQQLLRQREHAKLGMMRIPGWKKAQDKMNQLQTEIRTIKSSFNIMLGASNSRDMMALRLDMQSLNLNAVDTLEQQNLMKEELIAGLSSQQDLTQLTYDRIENVEALLKEQHKQMQASHLDRMGSSYRLPPHVIRRRLSRNSSAGSVETIKGNTDRSPEAFSVRLNQYGRTCRAGCRCICHKPNQFSTPEFMKRLMGRFMVGYAGIPYISPRCDDDECNVKQQPSVNLEYWAPLGVLWSQIIRLHVGYNPNLGPQFALKNLRSVADGAQSVNFALTGNISGLQHLFHNGLASPVDVSVTRGYSLLRWAMYGKQYETCKFLMTQGADPDYRPIAASDNCPRVKACDIVLQGGLSKDSVTALRCLTEGNDFVDEQNFTKLHKIVLKLAHQDLEEAILEEPDMIDEQDALKRTPLLWASARGDEKSVVTLLKYGADPNIPDYTWGGPVSFAADRGHALTVRLLLEAGAEPDPVLPPGIKIGSPLNCAARNATDPLVLKNLLDFGADVNACGVDRKTSLIHAARTDNAEFALVLLDYDADLNAQALDGLTPLTAAISSNSHRVLKLLLERWFEYSVCPRLQGPHLLQLTALFADAETMQILSSTEHFRLKYDKEYTIGDFETLMKNRAGSDEKLIQAFDELLKIIAAEPLPATFRNSPHALLEAGILPRLRKTVTQKIVSSLCGTPASSVCSYEDAMESPSQFDLEEPEEAIQILPSMLPKYEKESPVDNKVLLVSE